MTYGIKHHAALFAFLADEAIRHAGESGAAATAEGVRRYGRQRGNRMAARAGRDGQPTTMENYLLYGEWADTEGCNQVEVNGLAPHYRTSSVRCGWHDTWRELGLVELGKIYCDNVDFALVEGFDPSLKLKMDGVLTHGDDGCHFTWQGARFDEKAMCAFWKKKKQMGDKNIRDFLYHTGHLYRAIIDTYTELLPDKWEEISGAAMDRFGEMFGDTASEDVLIQAAADFTAI